MLWDSVEERGAGVGEACTAPWAGEVVAGEVVGEVVAVAGEVAGEVVGAGPGWEEAVSALCSGATVSAPASSCKTNVC